MKRLLLLLLPLLPLLGFAQTDGYFNMSNTQQSAGTPNMVENGTFSAFTGTFGIASTAQNVTIQGFQLTNNVVVSTTAGMEFSISGGPFFGSTAPQTITKSGTGLPSQPINIAYRITSTTAVGTGTPTLTFTSTGASTINVNASYTVNSLPSLSVNTNTITGLNSNAGTAGASQSIAATFANITGNVTAHTVSPIEHSLDNTTFTFSDLTFNTGSPKSIWYRESSGATVGNTAITATIAASGVTTQNITISGTVSSPPTTQVIKINVSDSTSSNGITGALSLSDWNDWSVPIFGSSGSNGTFSKQMKDATGALTTVQVRFDNTNFFVDNGASFNSGTTSGLPVLMFRNAILNTNSLDTFNIKGIPAGKVVDIDFYGLRNSGTVRHMTLRELNSGSTTGSIQISGAGAVADGKLSLINLVPVSGGLQFTIADDTNFWFCPGIVITIH